MMHHPRLHEFHSFLCFLCLFIHDVRHGHIAFRKVPPKLLWWLWKWLLSWLVGHLLCRVRNFWLVPHPCLNLLQARDTCRHGRHGRHGWHTLVLRSNHVLKLVVHALLVLLRLHGDGLPTHHSRHWHILRLREWHLRPRHPLLLVHHIGIGHLTLHRHLWLQPHSLRGMDGLDQTVSILLIPWHAVVHRLLRRLESVLIEAPHLWTTHDCWLDWRRFQLSAPLGEPEGQGLKHGVWDIRGCHGKVQWEKFCLIPPQHLRCVERTLHSPLWILVDPLLHHRISMGSLCCSSLGLDLGLDLRLDLTDLWGNRLPNRLSSRLRWWRHRLSKA
mmetsp:Transcript_4410/g.12997  ORF Transcript_4410/g.12997 Transcript_4410/m.12997 type:complete len:329 (-) Transcript_4410:1466-2452(-)